MRKISLIIIHCSAVRPDQMSSAAQIDSWHRDRGFHLGIGYHYVVRRNGEIEPGRPEYMVGAHCLHHNSHSIGVCYEGGLDIRGQPADTRTPEQKAATRAESSSAMATDHASQGISPCLHRRSSRPEPREGLSMHQGRSQ